MARQLSGSVFRKMHMPGVPEQALDGIPVGFEKTKLLSYHIVCMYMCIMFTMRINAI